MNTYLSKGVDYLYHGIYFIGILFKSFAEQEKSILF